MKLNARLVDAAKPREKAYKLADGAGLYLEVVPSGSRYWRMKYRFNGKEKRLGFWCLSSSVACASKSTA